MKVKGICLCWQSFNHSADTVSTEKETAHRFTEVLIENYWYWQSFDLNTIFLQAPPVKTSSPLLHCASYFQCAISIFKKTNGETSDSMKLAFKTSETSKISHPGENH